MSRAGEFLQDLGKALMMPISVIAAAGIFLASRRHCKTRRLSVPT